MSGSRTTLAGRLARLGFADAARAERLLLADLGVTEDKADALATQLQLLVDGSITLDLVRDDPAMACAAKEAARMEKAKSFQMYA